MLHPTVVNYALLILLGAAIVIGLVVSSRMNELFCISVRNGRILVIRGRVPTVLLQNIADIVRRAALRGGTIRAERSDGHARLVTRGINEGTTQQLRNVFGQHPLQKYRSLPAAKTTRNIGQILGVAWLAWVLAKASDET
jgi:hypothetical protein